jgi:hypothetical protein
MELTKIPSLGKITPVFCERIDLVVDNVSPGRMIVLFPCYNSFRVLSGSEQSNARATKKIPESSEAIPILDRGIFPEFWSGATACS